MTENMDLRSWRRNLFYGIEYKTNPMSDVDVVCRDGVIFYCHDTILGENLVLCRTLLSDLQESKEHSLNIAFDGPSVKAFLRFLYLGAVEEAELSELGESLLQIGHMYQEQGLFEVAGAKLVRQVADDNFDRLLMLAELLGVAELKRCCIEWMWKEPTRLRKAPNFLEIAQTHLLDDILMARKRCTCLIALGGYSDDGGNVVSAVYAWRPGEQDWSQLPSMKQGRRNHAAVRVQEKLYVMGGWDENLSDLSSMEVLDVESRTWSQLAPMPQISGLCLCAHIDGNIYAAENDGQIVVAYNISAKCWSVLPYHNPFGIHGFFALGRNLYFVNDNDSLSFRSYNVDTGAVCDCAPTPTMNRLDCEFVRLKDKIYSIGGWLLDSATKLNEMYDPASNTWRNIASLNVARRAHGVAVLDGRIYAVGGLDAKGSRLSSMEVYDPSQDQWEFSTSLPKRLCLLALVEVEPPL